MTGMKLHLLHLKNQSAFLEVEFCLSFFGTQTGKTSRARFIVHSYRTTLTHRFLGVLQVRPALARDRFIETDLRWLRAEITQLLVDQWNYIHHPAHAAGYCLDPENCTDDGAPEAEVIDGFRKVIERIRGGAQVPEVFNAWMPWRERLRDEAEQ